LKPTFLILAAGAGSRYGGLKPLSQFGRVARGVCRATDDGYLQAVNEITGIEADGVTTKYTDGAGIIHQLRGDAIISMNLWGFAPTLFGHSSNLWT